MRHTNSIDLVLGYGAGDGGCIHVASGCGDKLEIIREQVCVTMLDGDGFSTAAEDCSTCLLTGERTSNHAV